QHLQTAVEAINKCGVTFWVWEKKNADGKGSGTYDWTSLIGNEKKILLKTFPGHFPSILHKSSLKFVDQQDFRKLLYFDNISVLDNVDATLFCQKVPKICIFLLYGFVFCFSKSSSIINDSIFNLLSFYRQKIE
ncbi:unnamed protein product, partial [Porites evermanni]